MSDRFDEDLLDEMAEEPEAKGGHSAFDEFEGADELEASDEFDDVNEFDEGDEFDGSSEFEAMDEFDELEEPGDALEAEESADELEEGVTDALEAADADEFWGGLGRALKKVGKVMADEGDEMDGFDDLADFADDEEALDAVAPAIAGVAIKSALKHHTAALPRTQRRKLVKTVTAATKHLVRKHGPRAVRRCRLSSATRARCLRVSVCRYAICLAWSPRPCGPRRGRLGCCANWRRPRTGCVCAPGGVITGAWPAG